MSDSHPPANGPTDVAIRVDHVGIAVESVSDAEPILFALGAEKLLEESVDGRFTWAYYELGDASRIELLEPEQPDTFLTRFLDDHGAGLHHVTLEVDDIDVMVDHLESNGLSIVDSSEHETWTEAFVSPRNPTGTLFQLMEYNDDYDADRLPPSELYVNGLPVAEVPKDG